MNTKSRQPIPENSALNRLIFRKTPAFSLLFVGNLSAPSGRPGLPTRTEYQEYNTVLTKSIQHFLNSFKFFRAAGQRKCRAPEWELCIGGHWREALSAPPLGELLSEREAEGVSCVRRTNPSDLVTLGHGPLPGEARALRAGIDGSALAESAVIAHLVGQLFQPFQGDGGLRQGLQGNAH